MSASCNHAGTNLEEGEGIEPLALRATPVFGTGCRPSGSTLLIEDDELDSDSICLLLLSRIGGGGEIRTLGLRVMSPTRYHCATPLHSLYVEAPRGLEPRTPDYETGVLPLELWSPQSGRSPTIRTPVTTVALPIELVILNRVEMVGIEPTTFCSPNVSHIPTNFRAGWASGT